MDVFQILLNILDKPSAPKFYRELYNYYKSKNMQNETEAIRYLIENKFNKNENNS